LLYPHEPTHESYNPDSVMIDTCATTDPGNPVLYAKKWFHVVLPPTALMIPWKSNDSSDYNWRDLDSSFTELRDGFQNIENKFSTFTVKKEHPYQIETSGRYYIKLKKYANIDSVVYYLDLINGLNDVYYDMRAGDTLHPCWRLLYPHDPEHLSYNPDSVMLDTCATTDSDHKVLFAYKWYYVILPVGALNVPVAPRDSLVYRNWTNIDTNFTELRNGFQLVENKFSPFIMRKQYPDNMDSSSLGSRSFYIKFEKYFNIDSVVHYLKLIDGLYHASYSMEAVQYASNIDDKKSDNQNNIKIFPNPADGIIDIDITNNKYGSQTIEIYNGNINIVYKYSYIKLSENIIIKLDLSFLPNGIFFLKNGSKIKKFIISK